MAIENYEISVKGKKMSVPAVSVGDSVIIVRDGFIKVAEIFDEYWLEKRRTPDPLRVLDTLRNKAQKPDLFTFSQRVPDSKPMYDYQVEWENFAVIPLDSYEHWFSKQISSAARRNIKASEKKGVEVRVSDYDDAYVKGIMSIYNESSIRQGRRFWHYGKDFQAVKSENGTYSERSIFLAAYYKDEMTGYLKVVLDENSAAIMQILSKIAFYDKRPNNALLAATVKQCCSKGIKYLLYEKFVYGKKAESTLTEFKRNNGFIRMDMPRYYVPLSLKGSIALKMGLHKSQKERIPQWLVTWLTNLRTKWLEHKLSNV
jgi:hypothetical protein